MTGVFATVKLHLFTFITNRSGELQRTGGVVSILCLNKRFPAFDALDKKSHNQQRREMKCVRLYSLCTVHTSGQVL